MPPDYFALPEQSIQGPIPDVLTLKLSSERDEPKGTRLRAGGGRGPAPNARSSVTPRSGSTCARPIGSQSATGTVDVVAVVEIVSPGNKASTSELRTFVEKTADLIMQDVHLLVIDLFPPSKRDPQGIHKAIWDQIKEEDFELPADKRLTLASYDAGPPPTAYVEPIAVGDTLPDMPLFLKPEFYVPAPLEATYQETWDEFFPAPLKRLLETPPETQSEQP